MNVSVATITLLLITTAAKTAVAQQDRLISIGYNTFNEFYLGGEFPKTAKNKASAQLGYQFALSSMADYYWGPFDMTNPFLTNNAKGVRARVGYQGSIDGPKNLTVFLEYQDLQSNQFRLSSYSGSSLAPSANFTEAYRKIGVRILYTRPIRQSEGVMFTFSVALFHAAVTRNYSMQGWSPSTAVEEKTNFSPQITFGLKFLLF